MGKTTLSIIVAALLAAHSHAADYRSLATFWPVAITMLTYESISL